MSEKKARLQRRSLRRSRENSRLLSKAASVARDEHEREFDRLMSEARQERADAVKAVQAELEHDVLRARAKAKQSIVDVEKAYLTKRDAIVKRCARSQQAAA